MKQGEQRRAGYEQIQMESPMGLLVLSAQNGKITEIYHAGGQTPNLPSNSKSEPVLNLAARQLSEYFAGRLLKWSETRKQAARSVWPATETRL